MAMQNPDLACKERLRVATVRSSGLFGLDYVEVSDDQLTLEVVFLGKAPPHIEQGNLVLTGGERIRGIRITNLRVQRQADPGLDDAMEVRVNTPGDFSTYTLSVVEMDEQGRPTDQPMPGFDPLYTSVTFSFKAGCPTDLDCTQPRVCPPPARQQPEINYLAKDYESFRQLMLDRLALTMPAWNESHAPDLGIALVELLAYTGDYLSYYQDAVATEAYLGTARERVSVRRHARLVDYFMHEGCNARAWVAIATDTDQQFDPAQVYFITSFPGAPANHLLSSAGLETVPSSEYEVFQPLSPAPGAPIMIYAAHTEIHFYTWGDCRCCLAKGATSATLKDQWSPIPSPASATRAPGAGVPAPAGGATSTGRDAGAGAADPPGTTRALHLQVGDVLIFEEVIGPRTGNPADADPSHRQAVRLTKVTNGVDPLYHPYTEQFGQPIVEITWADEDALAFTMCISSQAPSPDCTCMENVTVARGNVVLVDNGGNAGEDLGTVPTQSTTPHCPTCCRPSSTEYIPAAYRPALSQLPLTFLQPLLPSCSAAAMVTQDPRQALPALFLQSIPAGPGCDSGAPPTGDASEVQQPCSVAPLFAFADIADPAGIANSLLQDADATSQLLLSRLSGTTRQLLAAWDGAGPIPGLLRSGLVSDLTDLLETWNPVRDLLESGPDDRVFVVEMDNDGVAHVRFGDGELGRRPDAGMAFRAAYRLGNGAAGNVGAATITYMVLRQETLSGVAIAPRNPFPASGGTDPEPIDDVKLFAPFTFRSLLERAITADDYAAIAADNNRRLQTRSGSDATSPGRCTLPFTPLQNAKATLRWTGSWYAALVAPDPVGSEQPAESLIHELSRYLEPYRRMGHDLLVAPARYVPLKVSAIVCVLPDYQRGHVEAEVLNVLSNRVLPDGSLGFFHPDALTFGDGVFVSRLLAAIQSIDGVQSAAITELERYEFSEGAPAIDLPGEELPPDSALHLGPLEIARLDNDPNFPENGVLQVDVRGGR